MPLFAYVVDKIRREGDGLRRSVVVNSEAVAVALGGSQRGVEAHADHVDDLGLFPDRHARETDVGQEAAAMSVDLIFVYQLAGLAASDIRFGFIIRDDQLNRPAIHPASLVYAIHGHL